MKLIKLVCLFLLSVALTGCIIFPLKESDPNRDLSWCLPRHTCASTEAVTFVHSIKPFKLVVPYEQAWPEIRNSVLALDNASIEHEYEGYIFAKTYTPVFHFLDYFEVLYIESENRLNVRSSSLLGLTDFFTNYFRTQAFRENSDDSKCTQSDISSWLTTVSASCTTYFDVISITPITKGYAQFIYRDDYSPATDENARSGAYGYSYTDRLIMTYRCL